MEWLFAKRLAGCGSELSSIFRATDAAHELYDSEQNSGRDRAGLAYRFNIPTVVNGHVYLGAKREVDVYGLLPTAEAGK